MGQCNEVFQHVESSEEDEGDPRLVEGIGDVRKRCTNVVAVHNISKKLFIKVVRDGTHVTIQADAAIRKHAWVNKVWKQKDDPIEPAEKNNRQSHTGKRIFSAISFRTSSLPTWHQCSFESKDAQWFCLVRWIDRRALMSPSQLHHKRGRRTDNPNCKICSSGRLSRIWNPTQASEHSPLFRLFQELN